MGFNPNPAPFSWQNIKVINQQQAKKQQYFCVCGERGFCFRAAAQLPWSGFSVRPKVCRTRHRPNLAMNQPGGETDLAEFTEVKRYTLSYSCCANSNCICYARLTPPPPPASENRLKIVTPSNKRCRLQIFHEAGDWQNVAKPPRDIFLVNSF